MVPAAEAVAVQVGPVLAQLVHTYEVGPFVHVAVRVMAWPTVGDALLAPIEQTGGEVAGATQFTVTLAVGLLPLAFVAISEYVLAPGIDVESEHEPVVELQPVHV